MPWDHVGTPRLLRSHTVEAVMMWIVLGIAGTTLLAGMQPREPTLSSGIVASAARS